jgi:hypothetical protein
MRQLRTSGSMSGDGKRGVAKWPKLPRPSSTLPNRRFVAVQRRVGTQGRSGPDLLNLNLAGADPELSFTERGHASANHEVIVSVNDRVKRNTAPPCGPFSAQILPP